MIYTQSNPLRILTPRRYITTENWPGESPVEVLHMDDQYDALSFVPGVEAVPNDGSVRSNTVLPKAVEPG